MRNALILSLLTHAAVVVVSYVTLPALRPAPLPVDESQHGAPFSLESDPRTVVLYARSAGEERALAARR